MSDFTPPSAPSLPEPPAAPQATTGRGAMPRAGSVAVAAEPGRDWKVTLVVGFLVLVGAVIGAGVVYDVMSGVVRGPFTTASAGDTGSMHPAEVIGGMCLATMPAGGEVDSVEVVDCDGPHEAVVVARVSYVDDEFPGEAELVSRAQERCTAEAAEAGADEWVAWVPTSQTWERDDTAIACVVPE